MPANRALAALLLLSVFAGCTSDRQPDAAATPRAPTAAAAMGPLTVTVTAYGDVAPRQSTRIVPRIRDTVTLTQIVDPGTRVKAGEVIARFNDETLKQKILDLEQVIADLEVTQADQEAQVAVQKLDNATSLKVAEDAVRAADLEQRKFLEAARQQEQRVSALKVQTTASDLARAEKRYADLKELLRQGFITEDEVEEGRINLEKARVASETARMEQEVQRDFTHPLQETTLANKLEQSRTTLEKTRAANNTSLLTKQRALETTLRTLRARRESLELDRRELEAYVVTAPTEGIVLYREGDRRSTSVEPLAVGQTLRAGQVLATLPDMSAMKVTLRVSESDITRVKPGQPVRLRIDALAGRTFNGTVEKVADAAVDEGWFSTGVKEFEVEVGLEEAQASDLRPGYSCQAEIICAEVDKALLVPVAALYQDKGKAVVYPESPFPKPQEVKVGHISVTHAEILSGLEEGQRVLLARPRPAEAPADS
jgi:RND family efflux transporter MFP subunit